MILRILLPGYAHLFAFDLQVLIKSYFVYLFAHIDVELDAVFELIGQG